MLKRLLSTIFALITVALSGLIQEQAQAQDNIAEPSDAFLYKLKESIVKVISITNTGGLGHGTGVAISKNHVVTNCHVIANNNGVSISVWGEGFAPVSMQADWKHDLCILRFEWANIKPVPLVSTIFDPPSVDDTVIVVAVGTEVT